MINFVVLDGKETRARAQRTRAKRGTPAPSRPVAPLSCTPWADEARRACAQFGGPLSRCKRIAGRALVDPLTRRPSAALRWCRLSPPSVGLDPPPFVTAPTPTPSPRFAAASCSTCPSRPRAESVACRAWGPLGALHRRGPLCGIHSFSIRKALQGKALAAR